MLSESRWKNMLQTLESLRSDINSWCLSSHIQFLKCLYVCQLRTSVKRRAVQALLFSCYKGEHILKETECIPWGHSPCERGNWCLILDLLTPNLASFCPITNSTGLGYPGKVACVDTYLLLVGLRAEMVHSWLLSSPSPCTHILQMLFPWKSSRWGNILESA